MGQELAKESPVDADIVISVPDSGTPAAIGYSAASKIPYAEGFIKNRYVGRTFIQPVQAVREIGVRLKLNPLKDIIKGKRIIVVDDSIVRGNTSRKTIRMLYNAGAREVHMRISSPPLLYPCYYGIDIPTREELIASSHSVEEIPNFIGADSLGYISLEGLLSAMPHEPENFCTACFSGQYRIPPENNQCKESLEEGYRRASSSSTTSS